MSRPYLRPAVARLTVAALALTGVGLAALSTHAATPVQISNVDGLPLVSLAREVQLVGVPFESDQIDTFGATGFGGIYYTGNAPHGSGPTIVADNAAMQAAARRAGQIYPFIGTDEEGGGVERLAQVISPLPWQRDQTSDYSVAGTQGADATHAIAMRQLGFNLDLAPVLDDAPATDSIGSEGLRSFSSNPTTVAQYGFAAVRGYNDEGIVPVVKHFPGLGHATANTDDGPATDPSLTSLEANDLIPFREDLAMGAPAVMMSHAQVPGLTGTTPASMSPAAYTYLTSTLHYTGMIITDALGAGALSQAGYSEPTAAVDALTAGADMVLDDASAQNQVTSAIVSAVEHNTLSMSRLNDAVSHVLAAKHLHRFSTPSTSQVHSETHPTTALTDGTFLLPGQSMQATTAHGAVHLVMETDGELIVAGLNRALWTSDTFGTGNYAEFTGAGNLAVFGVNGVEWQAGVNSAHDSLVLQSNYDLIIYSASHQVLWSTHTVES